MAGRSLPVLSLWGCGAWRSGLARSVVNSFYPLPSSVSGEGGRGRDAAAPTIVLLETKPGVWHLKAGGGGAEEV